MGILFTMLCIILMIVLHEYGHFLAARFFKIPVYEFSVGMGPLLFSKTSKKSGTKFSFRLFPVGGYCSFDDSKASGVQDSALDEVSPIKRIILCFAGPFANFLFGFIILFFVFLFAGQSESIPVIGSTLGGYPAESILQPHDKIISVNSRKVDNLNIIGEEVDKGKTVYFKVLRGDEILVFPITPEYKEMDGSYMIGITYVQNIKGENPFVAFKDASVTFATSITSVFNAFIHLLPFVKSEQSVEATGIVGIVAYSNTYFNAGLFNTFFMIMAIVSINLGIMNLVPIPGLDGSKIIQSLVELIFKKKLPRYIENRLINFSMAMLACFALVILWLDLTKLL